MRRCMVVLAALVLVSSAVAGVGFYPLGTPGTSGFRWSDAYGVTNDGMVVGSMHDDAVGTYDVRAFSWTASTGLTDIGALGTSMYTQTYARAVTPDGAVIIGESGDPYTSFRVVAGSPIEDLGYPSFADQSALYDVSDDGNTAVGLICTLDEGMYHAARWNATSGWQDLGLLNSATDYESTANAVSGDGSVVAGYCTGDRFEAFRWTAATGMVELDNPYGVYDAAAIAMSESGDAVTGQASNANGDSKAVLWGADGKGEILEAWAGYGYAAGYGISGDGTIICGTMENGVQARAVFWTADGQLYDLMTYLADAGIDLTGWQLTDLTEVSQNGLYLTGRGINADGNMEAFLVQLPEPGTLSLLLVGALLLRRRA